MTGSMSWLRHHRMLALERSSVNRSPDVVAPRQQAKWGDVIIEEEDDGLRTHAAVAVEPHIHRYAVRPAGLHRDGLVRPAKLCPYKILRPSLTVGEAEVPALRR